MNYKNILKTEFFKNTYLWIENDKKNFAVDHSFKHIYHVIEYAKVLARLFNLNKKETNLLLISAALHDVGYIKGRENHAENGAEIVKEFLTQQKMNEADIEKIYHAIYYHGGKDVKLFESEISLLLVIADKIDYAKDRYNESKEIHEDIELYRQVNKNELEKLGNKLIIHSYITKNFRQDLLKDNYFYNKLTNFLQFVEKNTKLKISINFITK